MGQKHFKNATYNPDVAVCLVRGAEWDKVEHWMSVVWMAKPPEPGNVVDGLGRAMKILEEENPGALQ